MRINALNTCSPVLPVTNHSVQDRSRALESQPNPSSSCSARSRRAGRGSSSVYAPMRCSALWSPCLNRALQDGIPHLADPPCLYILTAKK
jgi:hypothetical protein